MGKLPQKQGLKMNYNFVLYFILGMILGHVIVITQLVIRSYFLLKDRSKNIKVKYEGSSYAVPIKRR